MSEQHLCDICQNILTKEYYAMAIVKKSLLKPDKTYQELEKEYYESYPNNKPIIEAKEICPECYKVYEKLLMMRIVDVELLKQEFKGIGE